MSNNEWELVGRAKNGDVHAFSLLYQKYYIDLYRFAFCFMKNVERSEDVVSTSVLKAYENLKKLQKNDSFKSWLYQITANECRTQLRYATTYLEEEAYAEQAFVDSSFASIELQETLAILSEEERLVITLSIFSGYKSREIAQIIHKREGSVRSIKSRSLAKLRKYLDTENIEKEGDFHE